MLSFLRSIFARKAPAPAPKPLPEGTTGPVVQVRSVGIARRNSHSFTGPTIEQAMIIGVEEANKAGTSPTAAKQIEVWLADSEDGTNYDGAQTGSDAAMTHTAESKASLKPGFIQPTANTTGKVYNFSFDILILPGRSPSGALRDDTAARSNNDIRLRATL